jgi:hypothetical protein
MSLEKLGEVYLGVQRTTEKKKRDKKDCYEVPHIIFPNAHEG